MPETSREQRKSKAFHLTTDEWAVGAALVFALLVRLGLIHRVPW